MEFGEKIGLLIKERKLTQSQFAQEIGVNKISLNQYIKNARTPPVDFIMKVIEYFPEVDLNWLLRDNSAALNTVNDSREAYEIPVTPQSLLANIKENMKKLEELLSQK